MNIDRTLDELGDRLERSVAADLSAAQAAQRHSTATSRMRRRPVVVGIAATGLAVAGVATVLAVGSGSGSAPANGPSAGGAALSPASGPARGQDTAYVVKRVKARLADDSSATVIQSSGYASGSVASDGSLVNLGAKQDDQYDYYGPNGDLVGWWDEAYDTNGRGPLISDSIISPTTQSRTDIDPGNHTYSQQQFSTGGGDLKTPATSSEVQQGLQSGQVTQTGTATVNGAQAIVLSVKVANLSSGSNFSTSSNSGFTLYVDAQTYQPLRGVWVNDGDSPLAVANWLPATAANIAKAEDNSIPAGYTKVKNAY